MRSPDDERVQSSRDAFAHNVRGSIVGAPSAASIKIGPW